VEEESSFILTNSCTFSYNYVSVLYKKVHELVRIKLDESKCTVKQ